MHYVCSFHLGESVPSVYTQLPCWALEGKRSSLTRRLGLAPPGRRARPRPQACVALCCLGTEQGQQVPLKYGLVRNIWGPEEDRRTKGL